MGLDFEVVAAGRSNEPHVGMEAVHHGAGMEPPDTDGMIHVSNSNEVYISDFDISTGIPYHTIPKGNGNRFISPMIRSRTCAL
jgi:hypothetical protein